MLEYVRDPELSPALAEYVRQRLDTEDPLVQQALAFVHDAERALLARTPLPPASGLVSPLLDAAAAATDGLAWRVLAEATRVFEKVIRRDESVDTPVVPIASIQGDAEIRVLIRIYYPERYSDPAWREHVKAFVRRVRPDSVDAAYGAIAAREGVVYSPALAEQVAAVYESRSEWLEVARALDHVDFTIVRLTEGSLNEEAPPEAERRDLRIIAALERVPWRKYRFPPSAHARLALRALARKDIDEAKSWAERWQRELARTLGDDTWQESLGSELMARIERERGDRCAEERWLRACIEQGGGLGPVRVALVKCLLACGERLLAEREADALAEVSPDAFDDRLAVALALEDARRLEVLEASMRGLENATKLRSVASAALEAALRCPSELRIALLELATGAFFQLRPTDWWGGNVEEKRILAAAADLGDLHYRAGDTERALATYRRVLNLAERWPHHPWHVPASHEAIGIVLQDRGELAEARVHLEAAVEGYRERGYSEVADIVERQLGELIARS